MSLLSVVPLSLQGFWRVIAELLNVKNMVKEKRDAPFSSQSVKSLHLQFYKNNKAGNLEK